MHVSFFNTLRTLYINPKQLATLVKAVVALEKYPCDEVAIHFIGKKAMQSLHARFFNDASVTDCISFPMHGETGYRYLGDVFVCPAVAFEYARRNQVNPQFEISLYVVHGLLHLMGYDDIKERDRTKMRAAEEKQMRHLSKKGLLLSASPCKPYHREVACIS